MSALRASSVLLVALLALGCAQALTREGRCLERLTPQYLAARDELAALESAWRASLVTDTRALSVGRAPDPAASAARREEALRRLRQARHRHGTTIEWYERIYRRVRARLEEERLRSAIFWSLAPGPGLLFYPVVRWNLHTVMWDEEDPDAAADPVARYCASVVAPSPGAGTGEGPKAGESEPCGQGPGGLREDC